MDKEKLNKLLLKTAYSEPIEEEEVPEDAFSDSSSVEDYYEDDEENEYEDDEYDYIDDDNYRTFTRSQSTFEQEIKPKLLAKFSSYTLPHKKDIKETLDMLYLRLCNLSEISQEYSQY